MKNKDSDQINNDIEFSRQVYHDLLQKGTDALEEMMELARATEHPRAFEVLSNMMKNVADINGNLIDLHKKKKDIVKSDDNESLPPSNVNNNLFVGSTADLQKLLQKKDEGDVVDGTTND